MAGTARKEQQQQLKRNEQKWTKPLLDAGFTVIPTVIIQRQKALGIDPLDLNILVYLSTMWWYADQLPFPSKRSMADAIGVDPSTIRRRIADMEKSGLIKRTIRRHKEYGQQSNAYSFAPLIKEALPYAQEEIKRRKAIREERAGVRKRKRARPDLKLVKDE